MEYDPGWPVCDRCGRRIRRYQLAWLEHADGRRSLSSVLELDARSRRGAARVWHEPCYVAAGEVEPPATAPPDAAVTAEPTPVRRRRGTSR
jgi:hypothetical protein